MTVTEGAGRAADHLSRAMARTRGEVADTMRRHYTGLAVVDGREVTVASMATALRSAGWTVLEPGVALSEPHPLRSRMDDPATSRKGAEDVKRRAGGQAIALLKAYRYADDAPRLDGEAGLTDEEAHDLAARFYGLDPKAQSWKRAAELRRDGLLEVVVEDGQTLTRIGAAGSPRMVCGITPKGRAELERLAG